MNFHIIDIAATVCSVMLVGGAITMGIVGKPIPPEITTALGSSMTWLFVRGGVVLKDVEHKGP